eukprot:TRINITY_DN49764_c0_g1_i1.p1 TRINITY_DN49764_c0_g1~~TRINITY_DN49764_c0_g1_i1.p1  ORF type:complete len:838 (-),score=144.41 TRINITY_DN49764_c0_g1_i1:138-2651(-)
MKCRCDGWRRIGAGHCDAHLMSLVATILVFGGKAERVMEDFEIGPLPKKFNASAASIFQDTASGRNCLSSRVVNKAWVDNNKAAVAMFRQTAKFQPPVPIPTGIPKIALLFIVGPEWPMESIWAKWLEGQDPERYIVRIHSSDGQYKPKDAIFAHSVLDVVIPSTWCHIAPIFTVLARSALKELAVTQLLFFCQSTIPLKSFQTVYDHFYSLGMKDHSYMCADMEWTRGMPFTYVWNRRDAMLFANADEYLMAMFNGIEGVCDVEDYYVIALMEAERRFHTTCVTWSGWTQAKGFHSVTNGRHYNNLLKDPATLVDATDDCLHPVTITRLSEEVMFDILHDPQFLFARKFAVPENCHVMTRRGHVRLDHFLITIMARTAHPSRHAGGILEEDAWRGDDLKDGAVTEPWSGFWRDLEIAFVNASLAAPKSKEYAFMLRRVLEESSSNSNSLISDHSKATSQQRVSDSHASETGVPRRAKPNERVLVTGGAGFIGSHLADQLLSLGYGVRVFDDLTAGNIQYLNFADPKLEFVFGNLSDKLAVNRAMVDTNGVFHMAQDSFGDRSSMSLKVPSFIGTANLLQAASSTKGVEKVVNVASSSYYGNTPVPFVETSRFRPVSFNATTKYMRELQMLAHDSVYDLPTVNLRVFSAYGPRNPHTGPEATVTGSFLENWRSKKPLTIHGTGDQFRDFVHVKDIARGMILAFQSGVRGMSINLASGKKLSVKQVADMISTSQERRPRREHDILGTMGDTGLAKKLLNFEAKEDFNTTITQMMDAAKAGKKDYLAAFWERPETLAKLRMLIPGFDPKASADARNGKIREQLLKDKDGSFLQFLRLRA